MPKISESILNEIPEGYEPKPFTPVQIRNIRDLQMDHEMDPEDWVDEMVNTVTEMYLPAEMVHEQDEKLRMLQYRIDREKDPEYRQGLIDLQEELVTRYAKERVDAEEQIDERLTEETKVRYRYNLHILKPGYEPDPELDEKLERELSEEELMKDYQPAPFEAPILRSIDDQRELLEEIPEGGDEPEPVDEGDWAVEMYDIVKEEVMPASYLHAQEEEIRKLQHQINRINRNEDVANMDQPFELVDPDPTMLSPEEYQEALRDQLYKDELNRRFAKRRELEEIRDNYIEMVEDNRANLEEEVDRWLEEEMDRRVEFLDRHEQELEEQRELEESQRQEKEERERQEKLERQRAIEEERQRREEEDRAIAELQRKAAEEQAERERRREEYIRNYNAEQDRRANLIFAERVRRREEELKRQADEEQYRAEREARLRKNMKWKAMGGEEVEEEGFVQAPARKEQDADGISLGEFLNDEQTIYQPNDINLGAQSGSANDFFETAPREDIELPAMEGGDFFEAAPGLEDEDPDLNDGEEIPDLNQLLVDTNAEQEERESVAKEPEEPEKKAEEAYEDPMPEELRGLSGEQLREVYAQKIDEIDRTYGVGKYGPNAQQEQKPVEQEQEVIGDDLRENLVGSEELDSVRVAGVQMIAKPSAKGKTAEIIRLPRTQVLSAYRPSEEELKEQYFQGVRDSYFSFAGDRELVGDLFDARVGTDGKINKEINDLLSDHKSERFNNLNDTKEREQSLNKIKSALDKIPEEKKTDAQKKIADRIDKEIRRIPFLNEAEQFSQDVFNKGWVCPKDVFRDMYLAGEGLPKDHEYNKLLEDMRAGKSQTHPEFPARKVGRSNGILSHLQTVDDLSKAKGLLEKEGIDTPERKRAVDQMEQSIKARKNGANIEREQLAKLQGVLALGAEGRQKLKNLSDKLLGDKQAKKLQDHFEVISKMRTLSKDPAEKTVIHEVLTQAYDLNVLKEKLPGYIRGLTDEHPHFRDAMEVLEIVAPDKVAEVTAVTEADRKVRVEADIRRAEQKLKGEMDAFTKETNEFKVMRDNFAAVNRSYFGHTNSEEYDRMTAALNKVANSTTPAELKENKKELADRTKEYLEHTGLGKASSFHKNAETRRKLAFLALYRANSPERPYFDSFQASANQIRKGDDRIDPVKLANMPGVGKPLERVKEIDAAALADKVGANQPVREHHQRKPQAAPNQPALDQKGPSIGQSGNHS